MFSREPDVLGQFDIDCRELMFVQYMPIAMPGREYRIPPNLQCFVPLVEAIQPEEVDPFTYVYLTAKRTYVSAVSPANRPGWHIDGFGSHDINYIWSDAMPTEFCVNQEFDLSDDHLISLTQMAGQVRQENVRTYPEKSLIRLDNTMVHRVAETPFEGLRTFAKISVSRERYNLIGNAHNYLFDYDWPMVERRVSRNCPIGSKEAA